MQLQHVHNPLEADGCRYQHHKIFSKSGNKQFLSSVVGTEKKTTTPCDNAN